MDYSSHSTEHRNADSSDFDALSAVDEAMLLSRADFEAAAAVREAVPSIAAAAEAAAEKIRSGGRLIYCGAGTSGRLGVLDASECPPTFGVSPDAVCGVIAGGDGALRNAVEGAEDDAELGAADMRGLDAGEGDIVAAISAGGSAAYCVGALDFARSAGADTVAVSCNPSAVIFAHAARRILLDTGAEVLTGSTRLKAGTATKMTLNMLSTIAMAKSGHIYGNLMIDMKPSNVKLRDRAVRIVKDAASYGGVTLTVDEAAAMLSECGDAKTAAVAAITGADMKTARAALEKSGSDTRRAIELTEGI